ncbi:hypothetical protein GCM10009746_12260 [Microbacterium paludicola]
MRVVTPTCEIPPRPSTAAVAASDPILHASPPERTPTGGEASTPGIVAVRPSMEPVGHGDGHG